MNEITFRVRNFRALHDCTFALRPGINLLVGANGSGKSCILASLRVLRDILSNGAGLAIAKNGGTAKNYSRNLPHTIGFELSGEFGTRPLHRSKKMVRCRWRWAIEIGPTGKDATNRVESEELELTAELNEYSGRLLRLGISRQTESPNVVVSEFSFDGLGKDFFEVRSLDVERPSRAVKFKAIVDFCKAVLDERKNQEDQPFLRAFTALDPMFRELHETLTKLSEYNILPDAARASNDQTPTADLGPDGTGLSEVIHAIKNRQSYRFGQAERPSLEFFSSHPAGKFLNPSNKFFIQHMLTRESPERKFDELFATLVELLSRAVPQLVDIETQIDPTNGRRFLVFLSSSAKFFPSEVSDGTIKWLGVVTSILVPFSRTYLLEEPENYLHPWMQQELIRLAREKSQQQGRYFLITSHSPVVLNACEPSEAIAVTYTEDGTKCSRVETMRDLEQALSDSGFGLGDLWVGGIIGATPGAE